MGGVKSTMIITGTESAPEILAIKTTQPSGRSTLLIVACPPEVNIRGRGLPPLTVAGEPFTLKFMVLPSAMLVVTVTSVWEVFRQTPAAGEAIFTPRAFSVKKAEMVVSKFPSALRRGMLATTVTAPAFGPRVSRVLTMPEESVPISSEVTPPDKVAPPVLSLEI